MASRILVVDDSPTLRKVVSAILERHGYEPALAIDGQDAFEALSSGEVKADLILLDFVMPRMNGFQFCQALRTRAELANVPVVLMSAKADRIRDQFGEQTGALDAITKPFDAQALLAVVENALRRVNAVRVSGARLPESTERGSGEIEPETRRTQIAQIVATKLVSMITKAQEDKPMASRTELTAVLTERLAREALVEMLEAMNELAREKGGGPILAGDLALVPVGAVLQLLQAENQNGTLVCRSGSAVIFATFRNGMIDLVESSGAGDEFRLGRYLVEEEILTSKEIDAVMMEGVAVPAEESTRHAPPGQDSTRDASDVRLSVVPDTIREDSHARATLPPVTRPWPPAQLTTRGDPSRPLGVRLLEAGKITPFHLKTALTRQSSELLYEVFRWPNGRFELKREPPSERADSAHLALPVASVVMEGFRRVDEWRVLERTLGSFDAVLVRDDVAFGGLDAKSLPAKERTILGLVDGERTVRGIITASNMSSFDACRVLVQFLEARVLRRRP